MGLGNLGDVGDIGGLVGSVIGLAIAAIILLTFAPQIAGDIDNIAIQSKDHCSVSGERFLRVVPKGTAADGDAAWAASGTSKKVLSSTTCAVWTKAGTGAGSFVTYYTPKGTAVQYTEAGGTGADTWTAGFQSAPEWETASKSLTALSGGSLVGLLFGAMAILLPAGALGFLGYFGGQLVKQNIGGGTLAVAIGATVCVVIIGSVLPEIFEPLDALFIALDGDRYQVYDEGIGKLGGILGNFLGISLIGGLITLGVLLWKGREGPGQSSSGSMI